MIKVTTKNGETDLSIYGSLSDICADTVAIVVSIRRSLADNDPECGKLYEIAMRDKLIDLAFSAEPKKEEAKADKAQEKDVESEDVEDTLKELASLIGKLLK